jgi:thiamine biosynthesis lipoprotein ApbE
VTAVHRFRAMGCEIVLSGGNPAAAAAVFARWEGVFSRFLPASELTRVNAAPAWALHVSPLFARALRVALEAAADTDGLVDPTLGAALEAAGYDTDFSLLPDDGAPAGPAAPSRLGEVRLDGRILRRPPGLQLDLNGVVKALAIDEAAAGLPSAGFVSAGGDLAARGPVDVGLPGGGAVRVVRGGLATSGVVSRRWRRGGEEQHHLLDPRTGRPCRDSPWEQVTVSGASCLAADVAAKAAFLLGENGPAWLDEHGMPGRFVARNGDVAANDMWLQATSGAWHRDVAPEAVCT